MKHPSKPNFDATYALAGLLVASMLIFFIYGSSYGVTSFVVLSFDDVSEISVGDEIVLDFNGGESKTIYLRLFNKPYSYASFNIAGEYLIGSYPTNPSADIFNDLSIDWSHAGEFNSEESVPDFGYSLRDFLSSCSSFPCDVPIMIHSETAGRIRLSNLELFFEEIPGKGLEQAFSTAGLETENVSFSSTESNQSYATMGFASIGIEGTLHYLEYNITKDEPAVYTSTSGFTITGSVERPENLTSTVSASSNYSDNAPSVNLNYPPDAYISNISSITFNCSSTDDIGLNNITLWTNFTGTWSANQTTSISGTSNSTVFNLNNLLKGAYIWNCVAYDTSEHPAWASANRSFTVCAPLTVNTSWSSWYNLSACYANDTIDQTRNLTQYDANNCNLVSNQTFFEYNSTVCDFCTPALANTTTDWTNLSCSASQMNQTRNLTQYDTNNCNETVNQTFTEYRLTGPDMFNTTFGSWYNISACYANDTIDQAQNATQYDGYGCAANLTVFNYSYVQCDFCTPNITNTSWSPWTNISCSGDQMNQSSSLTQYDSNNCYGQTGLVNDNVTNTTYFRYQTVGPSLTNTSWSDWTNISCLSNDRMNQSRNLTQYDEYFCAANQTFVEFRSTETCDFCTPILSNTSWSDWTNISCLSNDRMNQSRNLTQYDMNNCNEFVNQTFIEFRSTETCDFCTPNLANTSWSSWYNTSSCYLNNTIDQERNLTQYDTNNCNEIANQTHYQYQTISCGPDITAPSIKIISPSNNSLDIDRNVTFRYNVTDLISSISNCSLIIGGNIVQTDDNIPEGEAEEFNILLDAGSVSWSINCTDNSTGANIGASEQRTIQALNCTDSDGDGFYLQGGDCGLADCDDASAANFPGAAESCDGADNDCDNSTDEGCPSPSSGGGGGGGRRQETTTICAEQWTCTGWSTCSYKGMQYRSCTDMNRCDELYNQRIVTNISRIQKPDETMPCIYTAPVVGESCQDNIQNQDETDVDCGGVICATCRDGLRCISDSDCFNRCNTTSRLCYSPFIVESPSEISYWNMLKNSIKSLGIWLKNLAGHVSVLFRDNLAYPIWRIFAYLYEFVKYNLFLLLYVLALIILVLTFEYGKEHYAETIIYQRLTDYFSKAEERRIHRIMLAKMKKEEKNLVNLVEISELNMYIYHSLKKEGSIDFVKVSLIAEGWPENFVKSYCDAYLEIYKHEARVQKRISSRMDEEFAREYRIMSIDKKLRRLR